MIIRSTESNQKHIGPMIINEYKINEDFSGALIEIDGDHGALKCIGEDRIYFILEGEGTFTIGGADHIVQAHDLIFVPKNTMYNVVGKLRYFLICSPEFDPVHDIFA